MDQKQVKEKKKHGVRGGIYYSLHKITDPPKILLFSLCSISNIAAMYQDCRCNAEREKNRVLGGSIIMIHTVESLLNVHSLSGHLLLSGQASY